MPESALRHVDVDACLSLSDLADIIVQRESEWSTKTMAGSVAKRIEPMATENELVHDMNAGGGQALDSIGSLSGLSCPECGGSLWQLSGALTRFRCHTGHSYTAAVLRESQDKIIEEAIWVAIRGLHEKQMLLARFLPEKTLYRDQVRSTNIKLSKQSLDLKK